MSSINPSFNPALSSNKKYSRLCYLAPSAYLDSEMGLPVMCSSDFCKKDVVFDVHISLSYRLMSIAIQ
jgi:hypothetical protein